MLQTKAHLNHKFDSNFSPFAYFDLDFDLMFGISVGMHDLILRPPINKIKKNEEKDYPILWSVYSNLFNVSVQARGEKLFITPFVKV